MKTAPLPEGAETNFRKVISKDYDYIPPQAVASTKVLMDMWERLGRPSDPFTKPGEKLMNIIIAIWEDGYPKDARKWYADRTEYKNSELSISEQISKGTGRSLASFPLPIYNMMHIVFPKFKPAERNNCMKLVRKWRMFQLANKI